MSQDSKDNEFNLPPHGHAPFVAPMLSCRRCRTPTAHETLSTYGALCWPCYLAYMQEPQPSVYVGHKSSPKSWAHALKARHEAGENLTLAQVDMYRAALQHTAPEMPE